MVSAEQARSNKRVRAAYAPSGLLAEACVVLVGTLFFLVLAATVGIPRVEPWASNPGREDSRREAAVYHEAKEFFRVSALTEHGAERIGRLRRHLSKFRLGKQ